MTLADLKEQIADTFKTRWAEFQETSLYLQLREKYDDLSPTMQRLVLAAIAGFMVIFAVMPPLGWMDTASMNLESFETKRQLIRDLLQLKRDIGLAPPVPAGIPSATLKTQVSTAARGVGLNPNQMKGVEEIAITNDGTSNLVSNSVVQNGVQLTVWKINLDQFIELSHRIQRLSNTTKLLSLDMKANDEDNHYFDVIYQVVSFSVPESESTLGATDAGANEK